MRVIAHAQKRNPLSDLDDILHDSSYPRQPAFVAEWLTHSAAMCVTRSVAGVRLGPGAFVYQRIISNDSYAHDEQGVNPRQVRGFDGVLYKLIP